MVGRYVVPSTTTVVYREVYIEKPPTAAAPSAPPAVKSYYVTVPSDIREGQTFRVKLEGVERLVKCPVGVQPGENIVVKAPSYVVTNTEPIPSAADVAVAQQVEAIQVTDAVPYSEQGPRSGGDQPVRNEKRESGGGSISSGGEWGGSAAGVRYDGEGVYQRKEGSAPLMATATAVAIGGSGAGSGAVAATEAVGKGDYNKAGLQRSGEGMGDDEHLGEMSIECSSCTFVNSAFMPTCEVCGTALTNTPFQSTASGGGSGSASASAGASASVCSSSASGDNSGIGGTTVATTHSSFATSAAAVKITQPASPAGDPANDDFLVPVAEYDRWARLFSQYSGHTVNARGLDVLPSEVVFNALTDILRNSAASGSGSGSGSSSANGGSGSGAIAPFTLPHDQLARLWVLADQDQDGALSQLEWCGALLLLKRFVMVGKKLPAAWPVGGLRCVG